MMDNYRAVQKEGHAGEEEAQWARILAAGHPAAGMILLVGQKACTAFHEFEPAWHVGALDPGQLSYFRRRLAARIDPVLAVARANGLERLSGIAELVAIRQRVEIVPTMDALAELAEQIHAASHAISDALERTIGTTPTISQSGGPT